MGKHGVRLTAVLVCLVSALPAAAGPDLAGHWASKDDSVQLTLRDGGTGVLEREGDPAVALTWQVDAGSRLQLSLPGGQLACVFDRTFEKAECLGPAQRFTLLWKGAPRGPPPPQEKCQVRAVEGRSAGPYRLGMPARQLLELGLKPGATREWLVGDHVRVQLDLVSGLAVFIALEGAVCVDRDEANPAACSSLDAIGGTTFDCPSRGYRLFEARPGNARVEIFSPTKPVAGCAVPVVPGTSVGPVHLGMRADALTKCGLGLVGTPNVLVSSSGAYQVELEGSPPGAAFIRLQVTDGLGACVGSTPLAPAVQPGALCASLGFCGCTTSADPIQRGTTIVLCAAQGIEFTFEAGAGLKHLRVLAARPGVK